MRVSPNARQSSVVGPYGDGWKVRVAAAPEGGKANAELVRFLAEVVAADVRIVSGAGSRTKVVELAGVSAEAAREALAASARAGG